MIDTITSCSRDDGQYIVGKCNFIDKKSLNTSLENIAKSIYRSVTLQSEMFA